MTEEKRLEGIRGWLILVAIGIIITPLRIIFHIITTYPKLFTGGIWEAATVSESEAYSPLWAPIIIGEILVNSCLIAAWLFMGYLFFRKMKPFPKWYIGITIFSLAFILVDTFVVRLARPEEPIFNFETVKEFARSLIMVLIWVPYMLVSKRVKATFVN